MQHGVNALAGPAEKTPACWRQYYPARSKQAAQNYSAKLILSRLASYFLVVEYNQRDPLLITSTFARFQ